MRRIAIGMVMGLVSAAVCLPAPGVAQNLQTRHVRNVVLTGDATPVGRLPQGQVMQLDLVLPLSNPSGLKSFLADVYNPKSPNYRHFLTPQQFTARFGPTVEQYDEVLRFAHDYGLEVVGGSRDRMEVQVKGTVGAIETAFHVNMVNYRHPVEDRIFYSADREPTPNLSFSLWHVSGLDNYSIPKPMLEKRSDFAAKHGIDAREVVSHATTGSGPSASFLGSDMRAAYYGGTALTGAGQNLGLLEYYGTDLADLTTYFTNAKQTNNVPITLLSTDGTSTSCVYKSGCDDTEQTLDMTQAIGMAPGLASLTVYIGSTDTAMISAMTTHNPLPTTIGCSWGWTPADPSTLDVYFEKMASQGQNFFAASGDSSTWSSRNEAWPADDANVVSVGGTDLSTSSAGGAWKSETAWTDSGGGISPDKISIPSWQAISGVINSSNKGSTTYRNGPDVSANANFTYYVCADQTTCTANEYGGTSFAAPLWAAYIALVNQQAGAPIGFIDPTIYAQNESGGSLTSAYAADFHDITSGTSGSYSAVTGYDLVTGWGSPNTGLLGALSGPAQPGFSLSGTAVSILQGNSGSSTITSTVTGGFDSAVALTASGQPTGVTVGFNPTSITGSGTSTMSLTVASTVAAGTYSITVTGTSGSTLETTTVQLTVTGPTPAYSVSASPNTLTIARGSSGSSTITVAGTGGFSGKVSLTASGEPSRVTVSFSPTSVTGSGTSTMKVTVNSRASTGTHTITITGTNGSTKHTTTVSLTVQ